MDWIKVLNKHILLEYSDLRDSEFVAWVKIMALTAQLEHEPSREQILKYVHYKTLDSLQEKLNKHSTTLQYVLNKVLIDAQYVLNRRESWKTKKQQYRLDNKSVSKDVLIDVLSKDKDKDKEIDKDKNKRIKEEFVLPEYIPKETWDAYMQVRIKKRAAQTPYAFRLVIKELERLRDTFGNNPVEVLNKSITGGWSDVYQLKDGGGNGKGIRTNRSDPRDTNLQSREDAEIAALNAKYYAGKAARDKAGRDAGNDDAPDFGGR